ncbi:MAG: class II glutamine amidotransferase, partial [Actinomycetota bacterium]|nr:class II glutamine amidotransferase [Actinomycetota bacterium]
HTSWHSLRCLMCRLYGSLATEPTRLECSLVEAQNALQVQSDRDRRGVRNADGWGIAEWQTATPLISRNTDPAFADRHFVEVASAVSSTAVIAHVRRATVGNVTMDNTHPFAHGPWAFAHNGTIPDFSHVATRLDIGYYGPPFGGTDSELAFLWILNRMKEYGLSPDYPAEDLEAVVALMGDSVTELVRISLEVGAVEPPKLNFLISDGLNLVATRWGNSLYWTFRRGINDCSVCGTSHCPDADASYKAVVVASEPITDEDWTEIPEGVVFGADSDIRTTSRSLVAAQPASP